jgi:hypothetical protein
MQCLNRVLKRKRSSALALFEWSLGNGRSAALDCSDRCAKHPASNARAESSSRPRLEPRYQIRGCHHSPTTNSAGSAMAVETAQTQRKA